MMGDKQDGNDGRTSPSVPACAWSIDPRTQFFIRRTAERENGVDEGIAHPSVFDIKLSVKP